MVPTLLGIMLINFALIQFVPGGPIEQIISQIEEGGSATDRFAGGADSPSFSENSKYEGARGLPEDFIKDLEKQFGFDRPGNERFLLMLKNYLKFDFGESYFRSIDVLDLILIMILLVLMLHIGLFPFQEIERLDQEIHTLSSISVLKS